MDPRRLALAVFITLATAALAAQAAKVSVVVSSVAGSPLADAVVMLEPATGRLPVKPMEGVQIAQRDRQFDPQLTILTVGTPVLFPNMDTVRHHVYSFSPVKTFQIKLYAGVPHTPIVFDKPGIAVLGCNIHDQMVAWVVVSDTPYYARSTAGGRATIEGVAPGSYQMHIWHSSLPENVPPMAVPVVVGAADIDEHVKLVAGSPK